MSKSPVVKLIRISLMERVNGPYALGSELGHTVGGVLASLFDQELSPCIVAVSLKGVQAVDAVFVQRAFYREILSRRENQSFLLCDIENQDLEWSLDISARGAGQFLMTERPWGVQVEGVSMRAAQLPLFNALYKLGLQQSKDVAETCGMSLANASVSLNAMVAKGLAIRVETVSPSGGYEYRYFPITSKSATQADQAA